MLFQYRLPATKAPPVLFKVGSLVLLPKYWLLNVVYELAADVAEPADAVALLAALVAEVAAADAEDAAAAADAAALVVDGETVAAAEEERFSRRKHGQNHPSRMLRRIGALRQSALRQAEGCCFTCGIQCSSRRDRRRAPVCSRRCPRRMQCMTSFRLLVAQPVESGEPNQS